MPSRYSITVGDQFDLIYVGSVYVTFRFTGCCCWWVISHFVGDGRCWFAMITFTFPFVDHDLFRIPRSIPTGGTGDSLQFYVTVGTVPYVTVYHTTRSYVVQVNYVTTLLVGSTGSLAGAAMPSLPSLQPSLQRSSSLPYSLPWPSPPASPSAGCWYWPSHSHCCVSVIPTSVTISVCILWYWYLLWPPHNLPPLIIYSVTVVGILLLIRYSRYCWNRYIVDSIPVVQADLHCDSIPVLFDYPMWSVVVPFHYQICKNVVIVIQLFILTLTVITVADIHWYCCIIVVQFHFPESPVGIIVNCPIQYSMTFPVPDDLFISNSLMTEIFCGLQLGEINYWWLLIVFDRYWVFSGDRYQWKNTSIGGTDADIVTHSTLTDSIRLRLLPQYCRRCPFSIIGRYLLGPLTIEHCVLEPPLLDYRWR